MLPNVSSSHINNTIATPSKAVLTEFITGNTGAQFLSSYCALAMVRGSSQMPCRMKGACVSKVMVVHTEADTSRPL